MTTNREPLRSALKRMPVPEPRASFADDVIVNAVRANSARVGSQNIFTRPETWFGAVIGAALVLLISVFIVQPFSATHNAGTASTDARITLAQDESRNVEVLIDSERTLEDATIKIAATGSVELEGLDDSRQVQWRTRLDRGRNVLSLPVVARTSGDAELVATIEHAGRARRVAVKMIVKPSRQKVA